ncbi:MAG: hypothetical protein AVDCRST_MAG50-1302, partial [uncultured Acidimicrobiales bacterium]
GEATGDEHGTSPAPAARSGRSPGTRPSAHPQATDSMVTAWVHHTHESPHDRHEVRPQPPGPTCPPAGEGAPRHPGEPQAGDGSGLEGTLLPYRASTVRPRGCAADL